MALVKFALKPFRALAWDAVKTLVRQRFPQAQSISTQQLATWLTDPLPPPILIDVRRQQEYDLSHLPGARHLRTVAAIQGAGIEPEATLVLYCSVGYRSARLAEQLQGAGYTRVFNLEGSIFEWFNQGHPVVADGEPVQRVHPYDRIWGLLLESRS